MSFSNQETSTEGGAPIELYKIEGSDTFYYTSSSQEYVYSGNTYVPVAITRSSPTVNSKESSGNITVKFPFKDPFVKKYLGGVPPSPDTISIYRVHLSDSASEVVPFWSGSVSGVKFSGTEATVSVSGMMSKTAVQIPTANFSWMCNHNLYDGKCRVVESDFTFNFTVVSVSDDGVSVTLSDNGQAAAKLATDAGYFNGGTFLTGADGSQRMGINFAGTGTTNQYALTLLVPIIGLVVGQGITFTAGCAKSINTCFSRFNNVRNYGGFPFVPTLNPFETDKKR